MKPQNEHPRIRHSTAAWLSAVIITLVAHPSPSSFAQEAYIDEAGTEVLTRGPVHEAFAGVISFDSLPGVVVAVAPPALIEEIPPGERPEGDDVTWIPGYWAWDDERNDFLWVSGIWRALPPGREWIVGYWAETTAGYQWTSGYWADAVAKEITYLPAPPQSVEEGPNIEAPSSNYNWTPGCWVWSQEHYAWSPGYWAEVRPDWDWMPSHYVWTRRGHVFVDGYWDHSVQHRGVLFAPVYFDRVVYSRPGYSYSPTIVIDLGVFTSHLFLRPNYDHYYFGDYYAPRYRENGFFASFSYTSSRRGYDSIYARQRWGHRDDRDWERKHEKDYQLRRDDERARPPHTWAAQSRMDEKSEDVQRNRSMVATSLDKLSEEKDSSTRFQSVDQEDRQLLAERGKEVQKSREQRQELESTPKENKGDGGKTTASKVPSLETPIAAKPRNDTKGTDVPPEPQRGPGQVKGGSPENDTLPQPGRPSTSKEDKESKAGKDMKPDAPQSPGGLPQTPSNQPERGRPSTDDEGRNMKPGAPQAPQTKTEKDTPQTQQSRPTKEESGQKMKPEEPQTKPEKATPQPQQSRPTQEESGRKMKPEVTQTKPEQPSPRPQPSRPAQEEAGKKHKPEAPQTRKQEPPSRPQPERPAQEEKKKDKKGDEEPRGKEKKD